MDAQRFINSVMDRLPFIPDDEDANNIAACCKDFYEIGYTIVEAAEHCGCFEEVNPTLTEEEALKRMEDIRQRVQERLNAHPVTQTAREV